jgi:hypothetical protein
MQLLCKKFENPYDAEKYYIFLNSLNEDEDGDYIQNIGIDYIAEFMDNTKCNIVMISIVESPIMADINYDAKSLKFFYGEEVDLEADIKEYNKYYDKKVNKQYLTELQKKSGEVFKYTCRF